MAKSMEKTTPEMRAWMMGVPAWGLLKKLERMPVNPTRRKRPEYTGTSTGVAIRTRTGVVYR